MLDPQEPIISIQHICDIAYTSEEFGCVIIEGLLIALETSDYFAIVDKTDARYQLSGTTKYVELCYIFSAILNIADPLQM